MELQMNKIKVFAPATISNVGCGFDTIGFAIHEPGDIVELSLRNDGIVKIKKILQVLAFWKC